MSSEEGRPPFTECTLESIRIRLEKFAKQRDWDQYHTPRNLLLAMTGEVGELAELFQWKGEVARDLPDWTSAEKEHLGEEMADVLCYLIRMADICGVDLSTVTHDKIESNGEKYPAHLVKGSSKKYTEYKTSWQERKKTGDGDVM